MSKLGKPVDRDEWLMSPQTVNAYYNPVKNEIVFPAAILQPPFFDVTADDAVNYGSIGAVIGHEIGHGFDDQGRRFDGDGKLRDWWKPADEAEFQKRAKLLVEQFNAYSPLPGMNVNGELTLGENIGDLGGLSIAYRAWKISLGGKAAPVIDGFTGDQRFFMGWAQAWRAKAREDYLRRQVLADPHAWAEFRANGPLGNIAGVLRSFRREAGRQAVPGARQASQDLVRSHFRVSTCDFRLRALIRNSKIAIRNCGSLSHHPPSPEVGRDHRRRARHRGRGALPVRPAHRAGRRWNAPARVREIRRDAGG